MFKNFYNSLNNLRYQYSVHNSLLRLLSNFQDAITQQNVVVPHVQNAVGLNALNFQQKVRAL